MQPFPASDLELTSTVAYAQLVNVASIQKPNFKRVVPGNATKSYLYKKLTDANGIVGAPMPNNAPTLSPAQLALFSQWIAAGAPND